MIFRMCRSLGLKNKNMSEESARNIGHCKAFGKPLTGSMD